MIKEGAMNSYSWPLYSIWVKVTLLGLRDHTDYASIALPMPIDSLRWPGRGRERTGLCPPPSTGHWHYLLYVRKHTSPFQMVSQELCSKSHCTFLVLNATNTSDRAISLSTNSLISRVRPPTIHLVFAPLQEVSGCSCITQYKQWTWKNKSKKQINFSQVRLHPPPQRMLRN